jgi:two-component system, NarL family, nitrate/nitrite response regulator NarL
LQFSRLSGEIFNTALVNGLHISRSTKGSRIVHPGSNNLLLVVRAQLLREALRKLLTDESLSVVAEASSPEDVLRFIDLHQDIRLILSEASVCYETPSFLDAVRRVASKARIVILASEDEVLRLGHRNIAAVDGVVSLATSAEGMAQSLRLIQMGERMVPTNFMMALMKQGDAADNAPATIEPTDSATSSTIVSANTSETSPSRRETQILGHLVNGCSNKVIARHLGITEATVKVHLKTILRRIRVSNRTQAAIWALNNGVNVPHLLTGNATSLGHSATL